MALALLFAGAVSGAGCGGSGDRPIVRAHPRAGGFAWLRPAGVPAGWPTLSGRGVALPYPPGWRPVPGDAGTATAALRGPHKEVLGYLNLTPRQGVETLADWASFRVAHNAREGDRNVRSLAAERGLRFRGGQGTCVRDAYTTSTGAHFIELACLVSGARATSVIVGAAPPGQWTRVSRSIERAFSGFSP